MKTVLRFPRLFGIFAFAFLAVSLGVTAESRAAIGVTCSPTLPAAGQVTSFPISCVVDCPGGGTVASVLHFRPRTTNRLKITIEGTCKEAVDFVPSGVTLQGAAAGDGLTAPSASANPVLGISGGGVILNNLTLSGGVNPLLLHNNSGVTGNHLVISGGSVQNVLAMGAIELANSTIENSAGDGIDAEWGGTVFLDGGTVEKNAGYGLLAEQGSRIDVLGGATISNNGTSGTLSAGALAVMAGVVSVSDGTIENNTFVGIETVDGGDAKLITSSAIVRSNAGDGVEVFGGSFHANGGVVTGNSGNGISVYNSGTALLNGNANVASNAGNGVLVWDGSVTVGSLGGPATIQSNSGNGIYVETNSVASFFNSGSQILNNTGWGIVCDGAPANPLYGGYTPTVSGNGKGQISCNKAP